MLEGDRVSWTESSEPRVQSPIMGARVDLKNKNIHLSKGDGTVNVNSFLKFEFPYSKAGI